MELHIGNEIEKKFEESGMRPAEFAKRINTGSRNIYTIFKRKDINSGQLRKIGEVLNFDFFTLYQAKPQPTLTAQEPVNLYAQRPNNQVLEIYNELESIQRYIAKDSRFTAADLVQISLLKDILEKLGKSVNSYELATTN